ncbi:MAG: hypothetical protein AAFW81_11160 [Pseudomonadota bacterium]
MTDEKDKLTPEEAREIDEWLSLASKPTPPADLKTRIMAAYDAEPAIRSAGPSQKGAAGVLAGLAGLLGVKTALPAGALAGAAALGFLVSAATNDRAAPEYEAYAFLDESAFGLSADDWEGAWDGE